MNIGPYRKEAEILCRQPVQWSGNLGNDIAAMVLYLEGEKRYSGQIGKAVANLLDVVKVEFRKEKW